LTEFTSESASVVSAGWVIRSRFGDPDERAPGAIISGVVLLPAVPRPRPTSWGVLEKAGAAAVPVSTVELPPDTYVTLQGAEFV
jgi:hypothetical protein